MQFALLCLLYVEHKMFVNSRSHKKGKSETRLPKLVETEGFACIPFSLAGDGKTG